MWKKKLSNLRQSFGYARHLFRAVQHGATDHCCLDPSAKSRLISITELSGCLSGEMAAAAKEAEAAASAEQMMVIERSEECFLRRRGVASTQNGKKVSRPGGVTLHLKGAAENWRLQRTNAHRIRNAPPRPPSVSLSFFLVSSARPPRPRLSLFIWDRESGWRHRFSNVATLLPHLGFNNCSIAWAGRLPSRYLMPRFRFQQTPKLQSTSAMLGIKEFPGGHGRRLVIVVFFICLTWRACDGRTKSRTWHRARGRDVLKRKKI